VEHTRVLVVDDNRKYGDLLCRFMSAQPDIHVVGQALDGDEALRLADFLRPHVVVMDLCMPGLDGVATTRLLTIEYPDMRVVALTAHWLPEFERDSREAGASAFVGKGDVDSQLLEAVRDASASRERDGA
jgi:DNA-binding NarL/FixJ family response regulator